MNSTNVPSSKNKKLSNPAPVCGQTIPTNNGVEIPPKTAKWGISKSEVINAEELGEIVFSQVETSKVNEKGILEKQDGTTISMVNPKAYQNLLNNKKQREEMQLKVSTKQNQKINKSKTGIGR